MWSFARYTSLARRGSWTGQIGRAACRGRGEISGGGVSLKKKKKYGDGCRTQDETRGHSGSSQITAQRPATASSHQPVHQPRWDRTLNIAYLVKGCAKQDAHT